MKVTFQRMLQQQSCSLFNADTFMFYGIYMITLGLSQAEDNRRFGETSMEALGVLPAYLPLQRSVPLPLYYSLYDFPKRCPLMQRF